MRLTLYALLGNRPLEQEMADKLESVVSSADFVAMFKMDPTLARIALSLASMQAGNLRDSTSRQRLIDAFIGIGRSLSQSDSNEPQFEPGAGKSSDALEEVGPVLLEIALNLSLAVGDSKSPPAEFAHLVTELIEGCTEIIPMTRPVIQNLCEELPIAEAQQFWLLLLRMRTL